MTSDCCFPEHIRAHRDVVSYAPPDVPPARVPPRIHLAGPSARAVAAASRPAANGTPNQAPELPPSVQRRRGAEPSVVGYVERIALPSWGIAAISAKVDTGAETSALHVQELRMRGATRVSFHVFHDDDDELEPLPVEARIVRRGLVRSSNGHTEERLFVRTSLTLGGRSQSVEIGLVDRSQMEFRMLVGRSALEGSYLVDPSRRYVTGE